MAALDSARKKQWKAALVGVKAPWIVCGIAPEKESVLDGMAGLIDWMAHGQVSRLLQRGHLAPTDAAILPGDPTRSRPSVLLFPVLEGVPALNKKLHKLGVKELALASSTFPEDFLTKLRQTLSKDGIRCTTLET